MRTSNTAIKNVFSFEEYLTDALGSQRTSDLLSVWIVQSSKFNDSALKTITEQDIIDVARVVAGFFFQ